MAGWHQQGPAWAGVDNAAGAKLEGVADNWQDKTWPPLLPVGARTKSGAGDTHRSCWAASRELKQTTLLARPPYNHTNILDHFN